MVEMPEEERRVESLSVKRPVHRCAVLPGRFSHSGVQNCSKPAGRLTSSIPSLFSATLLKLVYGIDVDNSDHELVNGIRAAAQGFSEALVPGKFLVEFIPWLEYIPAWFPGAGFQKKFAEWRAMQVAFRIAPFERRNTSLVSTQLL